MDTRENKNSELGLGSKDDINYMIWTISRCEWIICPIFDVNLVIFRFFRTNFESVSRNKIKKRSEFFEKSRSQ